jgi:hypothetical protein
MNKRGCSVSGLPKGIPTIYGNTPVEGGTGGSSYLTGVIKATMLGPAWP